MSTSRRALTLIGLTVAVLIGAIVPASATFSEDVAVATSMATGAVAAPASVTVVDWCQTVPTTTVDPLTGVSTTTYTYTYHATVSWPASTTARGVVGYRAIAHLNNGTSVVMAETNAATTSISATVDQYYLQFQPRVSVLTLTSYGWTAEGAKSPVLTC
jgi:hypothetical protein